MAPATLPSFQAIVVKTFVVAPLTAVFIDVPPTSGMAYGFVFQCIHPFMRTHFPAENPYYLSTIVSFVASAFHAMCVVNQVGYTIDPIHAAAFHLWSQIAIQGYFKVFNLAGEMPGTPVRGERH